MKALFCSLVVSLTIRINKRGGVYNQFCNQPLGGGQWEDITVRDFLLHFSAEYSVTHIDWRVVGDPESLDGFYCVCTNDSNMFPFKLGEKSY